MPILLLEALPEAKKLVCISGLLRSMYCMRFAISNLDGDLGNSQMCC